MTPKEPSLISISDYIAGREALLVQVDLSDYLIDYYLHRKAVAPDAVPEQDEKLKELIACFAIHLATRPPLEEHAWTLHLVSEQPFSLFVTGRTGPLDNNGQAHGWIVGNILSENIRHTDVNALHAQYTITIGNVFRSFVQCESDKISEIVEHFYAQSEQSQLKIRHVPNSDRAVGLVGLPDADSRWLESIDPVEFAVHPDQSLSRMRTCLFQFRCDCSPEKLLPFFRSLTTEAIDELYGHDEQLMISCPRCGQTFPLPRTHLDDAK